MSTYINYGEILGISSLAGAIVFAVLYEPFLIFFIRKSITHPTYVHYVLTFFCTSKYRKKKISSYFRTQYGWLPLVRVAGFIIRAIIAGSKTAAGSLGLVIADQILFSVGYFGLLYSAYTLVLDRWVPFPKISRTTQSDFFFFCFEVHTCPI